MKNAIMRKRKRKIIKIMKLIKKKEELIIQKKIR